MATAPADLLLRLAGWSLDRREDGRDRPLLAGIDLELRAGAWVALTGLNGSGKSSLLRFLAADESPLQHPAALLCQEPDEQIVGGTVDRELTLGRPHLDAAEWRREFGLEGLGGVDARLLAAGQKQRLALATALAGGPRVLLCDEPVSLQDDEQAVWVLDRLDRWRRESGGALLTATCERREAARADWLVVLGEGRVLCQGPPAALLDLPEVSSLLVDSLPARSGAAGVPAGGGAVLELRGVACRFGDGGAGFAGVDLALAPGERVGIVGPNGCGKSTLLAACAGLRRPDRGEIAVGGERLYGRGRLDLRHGQALLAPQFPEYMFSRPTVALEIALDPALADRPAPVLLERLGLPPAVATANPHALSGGQRRRLALGLVLHSDRPVQLLDEPTAGLDGPGRRLVLDLLQGLPAATALLVASHDRSFLAAACDRIVRLTPDGCEPV